MAQVNADPLPWLLEPDEANPGPRYFALRDLVGASEAEVASAQAAVMRTGQVPAILAAQHAEGYWVKPGAGYAPKYQGTAWSMIFMAQLGADGADERVRRGAEYVLEHSRAENGAFSINARVGTSVHCLWGNLSWALLQFGYGEDERLQYTLEMLARSVTGEGYDWYRRGGVQAPGFFCSGNYDLPCAWGAVRALWALVSVPAERRSPAMEAAIEAGTDFLLSYDLAEADYPHKDRISSRWFHLHYPLGYVTDMLLNLEVLALAGYGGDARLRPALEWLISRQDEEGRWVLDHHYNGKMWADVEVRGQPSKWVTLRALRALKACDEQADR
jgi:hypothetical protein